LFEKLDEIAVKEPEDPDGLDPEARQAMNAQHAAEEEIEDYLASMDSGEVMPLPEESKLDQLRILRGVEKLAARTLQPEHAQAVVEHITDVLNRIGGLPTRKRGNQLFRYRH